MFEDDGLLSQVWMLKNLSKLSISKNIEKQLIL